LNVYIKTGVNLSNPLWIRSGNRGNVWKITQISITTSSSFNVCAQFWLVCNEMVLLFFRNNSSRNTVSLVKLECMFFIFSADCLRRCCWEKLSRRYRHWWSQVNQESMPISRWLYCFYFNLNESVYHIPSDVVSEKLHSTPLEKKRLYLRALVSHTFVFVYMQEFGYYTFFRACQNEGNHSEIA